MPFHLTTAQLIAQQFKQQNKEKSHFEVKSVPMKKSSAFSIQSNQWTQKTVKSWENKKSKKVKRKYESLLSAEIRSTTSCNEDEGS
jgi:hypothetical protein